MSDPCKTFTIFGFVNTGSNLCNDGLNASVSTTKSAVRVDIYIKQVMPR